MEGATKMQDAQKRNGASGKGAASALISNLNALARVLRPVVTPERLLGWSLGIVYLWFGALKLANLSPVLELIRRSSPLLAKAPFYNLLAISELVLGAMLLAGVWKRWTAAAAVMHLIGTFSVVFSSPQTAFRPGFPILTMEGEFVVKNLVLVAAAGTLWLLAGEREGADFDGSLTQQAVPYQNPARREWTEKLREGTSMTGPQ